MRVITKDTEPVSLIAHRRTPHSDYDNYQAKDDLRRRASNRAARSVLLLHGSYSP